MTLNAYWPRLATAVLPALLLITSAEAAPARQPSQKSPSTSTVPPDPPMASTKGATAELEGGQKETLALCMSYWDASTQMSKAEWRQTCIRTRNGLDPLGMDPTPGTRTKKRRSGGN
jgi:hypothetical protein